MAVAFFTAHNGPGNRVKCPNASTFEFITFGTRLWENFAEDRRRSLLEKSITKNPITRLIISPSSEKPSRILETRVKRNTITRTSLRETEDGFEKGNFSFEYLSVFPVLIVNFPLYTSNSKYTRVSHAIIVDRQMTDDAITRVLAQEHKSD